MRTHALLYLLQWITLLRRRCACLSLNFRIENMLRTFEFLFAGSHLHDWL